MPVPFVLHLLALGVVVPGLWHRWIMDRRQNRHRPPSRLRAYGRIMIWQWATAIGIVLAVGWRQVWASPPGSHWGWLPGPGWAALACALFVAAQLARAWQTARSPQRAGELARALEKARAFLPQSARERKGWAFLAITSGICEEVMFRGFLIDYLHRQPWHLPAGMAAVLACVLFGLGHLYQGVGQALKAILAGALFVLLFFCSGSLLLPIAVHVFDDLYVLLTLRIARKNG